MLKKNIEERLTAWKESLRDPDACSSEDYGWNQAVGAIIEEYEALLELLCDHDGCMECAEEFVNKRIAQGYSKV